MAGTGWGPSRLRSQRPFSGSGGRRKREPAGAEENNRASHQPLYKTKDKQEEEQTLSIYIECRAHPALCSRPVTTPQATTPSSTTRSGIAPALSPAIMAGTRVSEQGCGRRAPARRVFLCRRDRVHTRACPPRRKRKSRQEARRRVCVLNLSAEPGHEWSLGLARVREGFCCRQDGEPWLYSFE